MKLSSELRELIESLRIAHSYCEDTWYSCPLTENGCANAAWPKDKCNCGATEHNAQVDALLALLERS